MSLTAYTACGRAAERESLSVARVSMPMVALVYLAEAGDFFEDENLDVTFTDFSTGREALASTLQGKHDLATVYTTPLIAQRCAGADLAILSTLHTSGRSTVLVGRRDRGIHECADLRGKAIGVTQGTGAEIFLHAFLLDQGLEASDIRTVDLPIEQSQEALARGDVDGLVTWHPYLLPTLERLGKSNAIVFHSDAYLEISLLAGARPALARKEEAVRRFIRALVKAQEYLRENETPARAAIARKLVASRMPITASTWQDFDPGLGLNHVLLLTLEREAAWFREHRECSLSETDLRGLVEDEYLRALDPEDVTLPVWGKRQSGKGPAPQ